VFFSVGIEKQVKAMGYGRMERRIYFDCAVQWQKGG
jgi:hypothetical protein